MSTELVDAVVSGAGFGGLDQLHRLRGQGLTTRVFLPHHVHRGAVHGCDLFAPASGIARRAHADRVRVLATPVAS